MSPPSSTPRGLGQQALMVLDRTMAFAMFDSDGHCHFVSGSFCKLFQREPDELIGKNWRTLCHDDDVDNVLKAVEQTDVERGSTVRVEFRAKQPAEDADARWIGAGITALDPDVASSGWLVTAADITGRLREIEARKQALEALRRSNSRLASLVDNLQVGVLLVGPDRRILASNGTFCGLLELPESPQELVGVIEDELGHRLRQLAKEPAAHLEEMARLRAERSGVARGDLELLDGRVLERTFVPIALNEELDQGHLWLLQDRTDERRMAARQAQLLIQEQMQNERLRELDEVRRDFASLVAHEFRTPLTSIIGYSQILELDALDEELRSYVSSVLRNGERLLRLLDDLLSLERLESRLISVEPEPVDIAEVVSASVSNFRALADEKSISLEVTTEKGAKLLGDPQRLGQMLDNLLANAFKFTNPGGTIRLTAWPLEAGWRIAVSDTGIGIPEEELPDLFERFYRASNAKRLAISGSGLGLAIVRAIVELHRGTISVASEEGAGTTFKILLRGFEGSTANPE